MQLGGDFPEGNGASEGIRTLDVHLGKVMLYQLSYARVLEERGQVTKQHTDCKFCFPLKIPRSAIDLSGGYFPL